MTLRTKLMASAGALLVSSGLAAAAPAVVTSSVNVRTGPGTGYDVIGALPSGAAVDVLRCGPDWCQVAFNGELGFASRSYLDLGVAAVGPGYRPYGEAYSAVPPGYRAGGVGYEEQGEVRRDRRDLLGVETRGAEVRGGARGEERRASTAPARGTEPRGNASVRANTASPGARVGANANTKPRETTGAAPKSRNDENRGPNFIGEGARYRDNHP